MSERIASATSGGRPPSTDHPLGRAEGPTRSEPLASRLRPRLRDLAGERGAATAEYAVATMAAVGFAGLLVVLLRGDEVRGILTELVRNALTVG